MGRVLRGFYCCIIGGDEGIGHDMKTHRGCGLVCEFCGSEDMSWRGARSDEEKIERSLLYTVVEVGGC